MRFQSLQITGYKRFSDPTLLRVRGQTLAVLGHNESGKTSLLEALAHIGRDGFAAATEFTDRRPRPSDEKVLCARFEIEESDAAAANEGLADRAVIGAVKAGDTWDLTKRANGERTISLVTGLDRDPDPRLAFAGELHTVLDVELALLPIGTLDDERRTRIRGLMEAVQQHLAARKDSRRLSHEELSELAQLKAELDGWAELLQEPDEMLNQLRNDLTRMESDERANHPGVTAGQTLYSRLPAFAMFDADARRLPSFTPFSDNPSAGLVNLLAAGNTTFEHLASLAGTEGARDALAEEERQINLSLEQLFADWSQREVTPAIRIDTTGIEIAGRERAAPIIDPPLSQRGEGMRMFAALVAFVHSENSGAASPPVLLVDEAELHLHYDAQADLVRVFDRQEVAQCVIYTTHSIGCLPEDLGLGIVVAQEIDHERSEVSQSFWTGGPGLTPIMLALGATALSFTPARRVLIGEGAHEAILLPTLLRETRDPAFLHESLGFQIVGGLSEISEDAADRLDEEAGTVLYLVDNDTAGRATARVLPARAREDGRVFTLGEGTDAISIEDFVSAQVLVDAIDAVLSSDGRASLNLASTSMPSTGRAKWAVEQFANAGSQASRTRLAQASISLAPEGELAEPSRTPALQSLLAAIQAKFPPDAN